MRETNEATGRGTTLSTPEAADMLGCSRGAVWAAARDEGGIVLDGELVRPIRVGRSIRWPTAPILRALGVDGSSDGLATACSAGPSGDGSSTTGGAR